VVNIDYLTNNFNGGVVVVLTALDSLGSALCVKHLDKTSFTVAPIHTVSIGEETALVVGGDHIHTLAHNLLDVFREEVVPPEAFKLNVGKLTANGTPSLVGVCTCHVDLELKIAVLVDYVSKLEDGLGMHVRTGLERKGLRSERVLNDDLVAGLFLDLGHSAEEVIVKEVSVDIALPVTCVLTVSECLDHILFGNVMIVDSGGEVRCVREYLVVRNVIDIVFKSSINVLNGLDLLLIVAVALRNYADRKGRTGNIFVPSMLKLKKGSIAETPLVAAEECPLKRVVKHIVALSVVASPKLGTALFDVSHVSNFLSALFAAAEGLDVLVATAPVGLIKFLFPAIELFEDYANAPVKAGVADVFNVGNSSLKTVECFFLGGMLGKTSAVGTACAVKLTDNHVIEKDIVKTASCEVRCVKMGVLIYKRNIPYVFIELVNKFSVCHYKRPYSKML